MQAPTVFISYSHEDERWKNLLAKHLSVLEKQNILDLWDDRRIQAGDDWINKIKHSLEKASVAVILISKNSLTSDFILDLEIRKLLERHFSEGLKIFPIIVSPCDWRAISWLRAMQIRPIDGQPLSSGTEHKIDAWLADITQELRLTIDSMNKFSTDNHVYSTRVANLNPANRERKAEIEITINQDFTSYTDEQQEEFLAAIKSFLNITSDITIKGRKPGSVKINLELSEEDAGRLKEAIDKGEFSSFKVTMAKLRTVSDIANSFSLFIIEFANAFLSPVHSWERRNADSIAKLQEEEAISKEHIKAQIIEAREKFKEDFKKQELLREKELNEKEASAQYDLRKFTEFLNAIDDMKQELQKLYPNMPLVILLLIHRYASDLLNKMWHEKDAYERQKLQNQFVNFLLAAQEDALSISDSDSQVPQRMLKLLEAHNNE